MDWLWIKWIENVWIIALAVLWLVLVLAILLLLLHARCAQCGAHFAVRQVRRQKMAATEYHGNKVYNILETYRCDQCLFSFGAALMFGQERKLTRYQKLYFKATCIWRIVLALVITPKVDGVCALADGVFQFG